MTCLLTAARMSTTTFSRRGPQLAFSFCNSVRRRFSRSNASRSSGLASADSYLSAFDARTGERVFRYRIQGDAPIFAPCVTYSINGRQFIAVAAGGAIFSSSKGNSIHTFALPRH